ncbi:hypothetical protein QE450_004181 [Paenibacillus sp. SORGH_AS306]|uniref:hypothetical protein n=1 Tax=unclassified Paenibacillus TaxID=185978 RepID=UPI00277EBAE1|nr:MULTISPECIES: hypothetical protein [unclassified Paenibacillus]MDQ1236683.1 hypothetical protein [Paenibacillus sp. SORGH_AS_0306]MDR6109040.1 hypothetical protein [Paenibacillus sp. SORGH_AS_0338]
MNEIIRECIDFRKKYSHLKMDQALPLLQKGWAEIGNKHGLTAADVFSQYMSWRSQQDKK